MWTTILERIATMDALWKKGFPLPTVCLLCYHGGGGGLNHFLVHCDFSWEIWGGMARDFGVTLVVPQDVMGLLERDGKFRRLVTLASECGSSFQLWSVGLFGKRNNHVFNGQGEPTWQTYRRAKDMLLFWVRRCKDYEGLPNGALVRNWNSTIGVHIL